MSENSVTQIPERDSLRRTISNASARLEMWADMQRKRAPELEWEQFDGLIEELKATVPGTGPVKDEARYVRGRAVLELLLSHFHEADYCHNEAAAMEIALEEMNAGVEF